MTMKRQLCRETDPYLFMTYEGLCIHRVSLGFDILNLSTIAINKNCHVFFLDLNIFSAEDDLKLGAEGQCV